MEKIIQISSVALAVSLAIYDKRVAGISVDSPLYNKELDRLSSMTTPSVMTKKPGTLGV
ncbi:hypothetical protein [Vibrio hippocampi]|uniref:Uncharacterized protein n=1 Tax=Vibrio hippocampi TaxID=654686 RepID=A0ABM8ZP31_9VIBR|nr:hypothetical protein [Vibrio hippocampi]CAH0531063.1 hypothetical protein VHP8226_04082 [Vibrio hippocampi]